MNCQQHYAEARLPKPIAFPKINSPSHRKEVPNQSEMQNAVVSARTLGGG